MKKTIICAGAVLVTLLVLITGPRSRFDIVGSEGAIPLTQGEKDRILGGVDCKGCVAEWVNQNILLGSGTSECAHGPEYDPDCKHHQEGEEDPCYWKDCKEYGQGNPCYNDNCLCYTCGQTGCEELIERWRAWCGASSSAVTACIYPACNTESDIPGPNYRYKSQQTGGGNCSYTGGLVTLYECGTNPVAPSFLSCRTTSCSPVGDWKYLPDGPKLKCKV